jgi:peptidoglycan/LPS O-acetylase OafA/YrhL
VNVEVDPRGGQGLRPGPESRDLKERDAAASAGSRLAGIEGLRALAAFGVLGWHVWIHPTNTTPDGFPLGPFTEVLQNGRVGVTMFFVLSGFLLYRPFAAAIMHHEPLPSIRKYFVNRTLRIIPAYWTVLLLVALFFQTHLLERPQQLLANMFFLQNYIPGYPPDAFHGYGIAPAWSLCVEVVFYLVLPVLAVFGFVLAQRTKTGGTLGAFAPACLLIVFGLTSLGLTRVIDFGGQWQYNFPIHADWFGVGMLVAVLRARWECGTFVAAPWARRAAAAVALVLALSAVKLAYQARITFDEEETLLAVSCATLLALTVMPAPRSILVRILQWRPLYAAGLASYSIFLWHDPLLRVLRNNHLTERGSIGGVLALLEVLAITSALSALTYLYVERPALALKYRKSRRARRPPDVNKRTADWSSAAP